ncbi:prepilin-type N-terminal cleavage/methylation domain-containing protein [Cryobacterium sp. M25]|uniref:type IV pilus modification PilV family protein n=1 Tax=Cryobacterium sp. M25 TaxID=2048293 RepID=UPI001304AB18|nr:type II secretion system protein [Cryobacterium sp. M25]
MLHTADRRYRAVILEDRGFGLIEVLVSMMLFAVVSVAALPLLLQSITTTTTNAKVAVATQIVSQQLEQVRSSGSSCSAIKSLLATTPATESNDRGVYLPRWTVDLPVGDVCTAPYLRNVSVRVWVTESGSTRVLSEALKLVLLDAP